MSVIDLSVLPAPDVIEQLNYETLLSSFLADFLALLPPEMRPAAEATLTLESEPVTKLAEAIAYRDLLIRQRMNEDAKALMLAYSTGGDLDHIGVTYFGGTARMTLAEEDLSTVPPTPKLMESDADYRRRLTLQPFSLSVAGPEKSYVFHALGAHENVADATAVSPSPSVVTVTVLGRNAGNVPDAETLSAVEAALDDKTVRPLGDRVTVQAVTIVQYQITAEVIVPLGPDASAIGTTIAANVAAYKDAPRRIGRDVTRSAIYAALHVAGVERVNLTQPAADVALDHSQASQCTAVNITVNGVPLVVA